MKIKTIKYIVVLITGLYALSTIFYVQPNNPLRIKYSGFINFFDLFFNQQWAFFSPPPVGSHKLVYQFFNSDTILIRQVEVLSPILEAKRQNAPFNMNEEILDYCLSGALISLTDLLREQYKTLKVNKPDTNDIYYTNKALEIIHAVSDNLPTYLTLHNYGQLVYQRINVNESTFDVLNIKYHCCPIKRAA